MKLPFNLELNFLNLFLKKLFPKTIDFTGLPTLIKKKLENYFKKNLALSKKYFHLCIRKNKIVRFAQLHIESKNWFSLIDGDTICGACFDHDS